MSDHSTTADRSTAVDPSTTASRSTPVEQSTACPLCSYTGETRNATYTHLLTSHRKSSISELLLECQPADAPH
ncbi:hypothetical protein [Natronorubrum halophilum]|uniref:hypothetical protein n=1 Tax=Natronorubrum halophilum TaxID=1702106 RepID=UPI000EF6F3E8|nr:hypothetical protein [Natronorubrum halophilum]